MIRKITLFVVFSSFILLQLPLPADAINKAKSTSAVLATTSAMSQLVPDSRADVLKRFLERYNSPLAQDSQAFVEEADKNNIDWKLVPAISGVESTFGLAVPLNCNNAWGYNIYGDHTRCFESYKAAIKVISYDLRHLYMDQWKATDIYSLGHHYAASPTWSVRVDGFMQDIGSFEAKTTNPRLPISL